MALFKDGGLGDFGLISTLDFYLETLESLLQGVLGTSVDHLSLGLGGVGSPQEENNLGALTIGTSVVLEVEDGVAAVILRELRQEGVVGRAGVTSGQQFHSLVVRGQGHNDVSVLVAQLEFVEFGDDGLVDGDTGGLRS